MDYYNRILQKKPIYKAIVDAVSGTEENLYTTVMMPVLLEFVTWVLEEAAKRGKERLYFLARDGYQMYLVAQKLCRIKGIPIDCRYLRVSRYAMRVPQYHLLEEKCIDHICIGGIDVTIERIMKRAALTDEEAKQITQDRDCNRILNYQEVMRLKDELCRKPDFLKYIYAHSKESYEPAIAYLKQEGLFEDIDYALVDSGWVGTLQQSIAHLVGNDTLEGFYFGMFETPKGVDPNRYHAFYFSPKKGMRRKVHFSNCLFEAIFTSPEGMTLGYEKNGDVYVPVSDYCENPNKEHIDKNCKLLEEYMAEYEKCLPQFQANHREPSVAFVEKLLHSFMGYPTKMEVLAYGDLLFSDDILEGNLKKVAADLTKEEICRQRFINKALIMLGLRQGELRESAWLEGSIVKEGYHIRKSLRHAKLYKYFVYLRKLLK